MKIPYPIKDYFVDEQYDFSESLERWRWEFIRRNPEYQAFYEKHKTTHTLVSGQMYGSLA